MFATPRESDEKRSLAPREWVLLAAGWIMAAGAIFWQRDTLESYVWSPSAKDFPASVGQAGIGHGTPLGIPDVGSSSTGTTADAALSELSEMIGFEALRIDQWESWTPMEPPSSGVKEQMLRHAISFERAAMALGRTDWRQQAKYLAVAGESYVIGGADSPRYLERGADALVAAADVARQNGEDAFAQCAYNRSLRVYEDLLALVGTASGELRARVVRKKAFVQEEVPEGSIPVSEQP